MAEDASRESGNNVLDYASPRTRGEPVNCVGATIGAVLLLILATALLSLWTAKAKPIGQRPQCGTNEHQLLTLIFDYAQKNGGSTPASLGQLQASLGTSSSTQKIFQCMAGPGGYIYVGQGLSLRNVSKGTILIYEPPTNHKDTTTGKNFMNVAYADGAVRRVVQPQADKIIAELQAGHNPPREEIIK